MTYSSAQIIELNREHLKVNASLIELYMRIPEISLDLSSEAREHALYGVCRRIGIIRECLFAFFELLPPDVNSEPEMEVKMKVDVHLHAFLINVCGIVDNMAWLWAYHAGIDQTIDLEKKKRSIGLFDRSFYRYLPVPLQAKVTEFMPWYNFVVKHRHPTAHRIPPYLVPYTSTEDDDPPERRDCTPRYIHSHSSEHGLVPLHPQSLVDSNTIISLLETLIPELSPPEA